MIKKNNRKVFLRDMGLDIEEMLNIASFHKIGFCVRQVTGKRETWRLSLSGNTFYVKLVFYSAFHRKILSFLKLSKSRKEVRLLQGLKDRGILVPELAAYVQEGGSLLPDREYIVTREIEGSRTLKDFFFTTFSLLSRREQKKLIEDFAIYIKELHESGIMHHDPNLGNFLIRQDSGGNRFYLMDLSGVSVKTSLSLNDRLRNLALINLNFYAYVEKALRYYFFKKYSIYLPEEKAKAIEAISMIESMTLEYARRLWRKRADWCLAGNSFFTAARHGPYETHCRRSRTGENGIREILKTPDVFLDGMHGPVLKDGRTVKAAAVNIGDGNRVFLKRYNRKGLFHTFKNMFRRSRARKVWVNSFGFELRRIPVPSPVAYMEERKFRVLKSSYIVSEFIPDTETLGSMFQKSGLTGGQKISIMHLMGREVGKMHRLGCLHGDVKWGNILITRLKDRFRCFFIDLDGSRIRGKLSVAEMLRETGRFYIEMIKYALKPEERDAFMSSYHKHSCLKIPYETFVAKVDKKARMKI